MGVVQLTCTAFGPEKYIFSSGSQVPGSLVCNSVSLCDIFLLVPFLCCGNHNFYLAIFLVLKKKGEKKF